MRIHTVAQQVIICSVLMSVLSLAFLGFSHLLKKKQSARWRYAVWWVLGLGFLFPFKPQLVSSPLNIDPAHVTAMSDGSVLTYVPPQTDSFFRTFLVVWCIGCGLTALSLLRGHLRFGRSIRRLRKNAPEPVQTVLQLTCIEMDMRPIPVYTVPVIPSPMLLGLSDPCILLPEQEFGAEELRLVFRHELTHRRHGDLWCKLLWLCVRAVHWMNPLIPFFIRRMEQDCELACDESVMQGETPESAAVYCNSILDTALRHLQKGSPVLATNFSGSREMLRERMAAILAQEKKHRFWLIPAGAALLTLLTGSVFALTREELYSRQRIPTAPSAEQGLAETTAVMTTTGVYIDGYLAGTLPAPGTSVYAPSAEQSGTSVFAATAPQTTATAPVFTTVYVGEDGMIYAVTAYPQGQSMTTAVMPGAIP